jgi:hypothetical protein
MRAFFHNLVASAMATRYLVSYAVLVIALGYGILTIFSYVPLYTKIGAPVPVIFTGLYTGVFGLVVSIWYLWVIRPNTFIAAPSVWHTIYTQTDRTGLLWLNLLALATVIGVTFWLRTVFVNAYLTDAAIFFAIVIGAPLVIDLLPFRRPRRAVVPQNGQTLLEIASALAPDQTSRQDLLGALYAYNQLNVLLPSYTDPNDYLPDGLVIWIPPEIA